MAEKKSGRRTRAPSTEKADAEKRTYFKQADFPQTTLQQAQKIVSALIDNFAGRDGSPPDIALAIGISPTSSAWPALAGASIAYGLTEGGVNANAIKLTCVAIFCARRSRKPTGEVSSFGANTAL